ncbi:MarR family winged helix-turn-helix transcriptional regulator [Rhodococcus qingshengii]|uniref:MarR family winged helix-turn-helix transcriptional regulator n=1 Tax=Rhodococcus qingshengii TaxID=334542 RepID=UPI001C5DBBC3|nr:MarR family transcriptional regulator [Rhodococcus qingshengii]MBW4818771.1 MarR family transcriptional regulator [Rhodococcus qingshengii]
MSRGLIRAADRQLGARDLSAVQFYALGFMTTADGISMSGIAASLGLRAATATRVVDSLISRGLAVRVHDEADRRRLFVHASAKGRNVHQQLLPSVLVAEAEFIRSLEDRDRECLQELSAVLDQ